MSLTAFPSLLSGRPPGPIGVAVSGGSDSLALLHLMRDWGLGPLHAVTVNHGLRPEAASEALHVERICRDLGISHSILGWTGWDGKGNLQDQARRNRYALIADWSQGQGIGAVALGHTRDDVAETFLMRLARSAGVDGLAAMEPAITRHGVAFLRPLLDRSRAELRAFLTARGVRWVEDPSNADEDFERVKARRVLAALQPLGIDTATLAASAGHLRDARTALSKGAADWAMAHAKVVGGDVIFDRSALSRLLPEQVRRLVAGGLAWVAGAEYRPRQKPVADLMRTLHGPTATTSITLHGCRVMFTSMTIRITREHAAVADLRGPTDQPWDGRWILEGPHAPDLEIRALGEAVKDCPDWRETKLPRATLLASPSVWRGETLIAAPLAGLPGGWAATTGDLSHFAAVLISH